METHKEWRTYLRHQVHHDFVALWIRVAIGGFFEDGNDPFYARELLFVAFTVVRGERLRGVCEVFGELVRGINQRSVRWHTVVDSEERLTPSASSFKGS